MAQAPAYPYYGTDQRFYTQYMEVLPDGGQRPLTAEPGGSYVIIRSPGNPGVPVPPGDGRWGNPASSSPTTLTRKGADA